MGLGAGEKGDGERRGKLKRYITGIHSLSGEEP